VTGIIRPGTGPGTFFLQPGDLGFQVAYALAETVQLGGHPLVRPADMAEERLRHDGGSSYLGETDSMSSHTVANQMHCLWRRDGEDHVVFTAAAPGFHGLGRAWSQLTASRALPGMRSAHLPWVSWFR
jgi:hypothetical protein